MKEIKGLSCEPTKEDVLASFMLTWLKLESVIEEEGASTERMPLYYQTIDRAIGHVFNQ